MIAVIPTFTDGTRPTIYRPSSCGRSAIDAVFGIFCRSSKFSSVYKFVARNTNGYSVGYVDYQFWIFRNWLYVVGVKFTHLFSTFLTSIVVAPINFIAPFRKIPFCFRSFIYKAYSALPMSSPFASKIFAPARTRTIPDAFIWAYKSFATVKAVFWNRRISVRPTSIRAILGFIRSISLDIIRRIANSTYFCNLSIFHIIILSPFYCAVKRMATAFPELTIERVVIQ